MQPAGMSHEGEDAAGRLSAVTILEFERLASGRGIYVGRSELKRSEVERRGPLQYVTDRAGRLAQGLGVQDSGAHPAPKQGYEQIEHAPVQFSRRPR